MHKVVGNKKMEKTQTQPEGLTWSVGMTILFLRICLTGCIFQKTQCQEERSEPKIKEETEDDQDHLS